MNRFEKRQTEMRETLMSNNQLNFQKKQTLFGVTTKTKENPTNNLPRLRITFEVKQGNFPGYDHVNLKFFIHHGSTWNLETGLTAGVSHCVSRRACGKSKKTPKN